MGLLSAASDAVGGVFGDQWKDFFTVPNNLSSTAAMFAAVKQSSNAGRGTNHQGSDGIISNGSRILVPEGYALVLMEDGGITGFAVTPGAYEWWSNAPDSQSFFAGDGIVSPLIKQSWGRFKFGGRPQAQQQAFFVSLKELPANRFGTPTDIYWDDAFLNTQVGGRTRGTYTLKIEDPILFIQNYVPAKYLRPGRVFDFTDHSNDASKQLFNEVVGSLSQALSLYVNDPSRENRMTKIQQNSTGFTHSLSQIIEENHRWRSARGLQIVSTSIVGIEYNQKTRELLETVQRADALLGTRGDSNMQAAVAAGLEAAGKSGEGLSGMFGLAMTTSMTGVQGLRQESQSASSPARTANPAGTSSESAPENATLSFAKLKQLFEAELITASEYEAAKARLLGL